MTYIRILTALTLSLSAFASSALAHDYKIGSLAIDQPWTRATPGGAKVGGGYLTIKNTGHETDRLVAGAADFAGKVEIHEMAMKDGVMRMRRLSAGLEIPPGETVELKPGGYHVMFMQLKAPLVEGNPVTATLTFEKAGSIALEFAVEPVGARGSGDGEMDHSGHGTSHGQHKTH